MTEPKEHWHLDKRVPISLIATMLAQTVAIVWWASSIDNRVTQLENVTLDQRSKDAASSSQLQQLNNNMTRLDTSFSYMIDSQQEMKDDIRTLLDESRSN